MADIYKAYQEYLNNIGEYVPSASDVYSGIAGLTSRVPQVARDVLLPSDNGDGGKGGGGGGGGTGGIGNLMDKYNDLGFIGRGAVNTAIGLAFPQAAGLLGLYNTGKGIYDFGRGVLGYNDPALSGYDQLNDPYGFNDGGVDTFGGSTVGTAFGDVRGLDEDESPNDTAGDYGGGSEVGSGDDNDPGYDSGDYE